MEHSKSLREKFPQQPDFQVSYVFPEATRGSGYLTGAHWHEHVELLYVVQGELRVNIRGSWQLASEGNIVAINAGEIHSIPEKSEDTLYACLIPHKALCARMGVPVEKLCLASVIWDRASAQAMEEIFTELREKPPYYKAGVQAKALNLIIQLARTYGSVQKQGSGDNKVSLVMQAVEFMASRYDSPISTGDVCAALGFDKSYVCNTFKTITGTTILEHLNMVRCEHARDLLLSGDTTVADCAARCGFRNLSYFTKTYRRYMGELPSETGKK